MKIEAITFDLWDTVIRDDSDEAVRAAKGLRTKLEERIFLIWQALNCENDTALLHVEQAYTAVDDEFRQVWHDQFITWSVSERVERILKELNRTLPEHRFEKLTDALEYMEIEIPPVPVEGIGKALEKTASVYPLAVVSDAIFTPGRYLMTWLDKHDLLQYFSGFAFSDEVGRSKPHKDIFRCAAERLGTKLENMVHIGDREHNDINGAHAAGMKAVLFYGARDADCAGTAADAKFRHYADLPDILNGLAEA